MRRARSILAAFVRRVTPHLGLMSAVAHIALGIGIIVGQGASASSPAWAILGRYLPDWFWPSLFLIEGILALIGTRSVAALRYSLWIGAMVMAVWGIGLLAAAIILHTFQPAALWLLYLSRLKWDHAENGLKQERQRLALQAIAERAEQLPDASSAGGH